MARILHITTEAELEAAQASGTYRPAAFDREGFIHCSYRGQAAATANRLFRGRPNLVLLEIETTRLPADVIDENLEGGSELFPHIYGPLPLSAVVRVHRFPCDESGVFTLPDAIA